MPTRLESSPLWLRRLFAALIAALALAASAWLSQHLRTAQVGAPASQPDPAVPGERVAAPT